jgi:cytochrome c oxidase cbb3-type subunit 2
MPSFADAMTDEERWAIAYHVLAFSAWADPLTGERLRLPAAARAALNSREVTADHPRAALDPARPRGAVAERGPRRRYYPGITD